MAELTLDKSDPAVNELIGSWQDGQEYYIRLKQVKTDGNLVTFEAEDETQEEEPEEAPAKSASPGPPNKNPALMILVGKHGKE